MPTNRPPSWLTERWTSVTVWSKLTASQAVVQRVIARDRAVNRSVRHVQHTLRHCVWWRRIFDIFRCNCRVHSWILITFGRNVSQKAGSWKWYNFPLHYPVKVEIQNYTFSLKCCVLLYKQIRKTHQNYHLGGLCSALVLFGVNGWLFSEWRIARLTRWWFCHVLCSVGR